MRALGAQRERGGRATQFFHESVISPGLSSVSCTAKRKLTICGDGSLLGAVRQLRAGFPGNLGLTVELDVGEGNGVGSTAQQAALVGRHDGFEDKQSTVEISVVRLRARNL